MWIHVPSTSCPSVPEAADSIEASIWRSEMLARSVTSSGNLTPARSWRAAWKKATWTTRLFGRILKPSTAEDGVERWISSLGATPASHSRLQAKGLASAIQGTYGPMFVAALQERERRIASSRTSQGTLALGSTAFYATSTDLGTGLRSESSQRRKLARATEGNGSLSSAWPTADATNRTRDDETMAKCAAFRKRNAGQNTVPLYLAEVAQMWPTPHAFDEKEPMDGNREDRLAKGGCRNLRQETVTWPTAKQTDDRFKRKSENWKGDDLPSAVDAWATPDANSSTYSNGFMGPNLREQAAQWATPKATDDQRDRCSDEALFRNAARENSSQELSVDARSFHQAQATEPHGDESSQADQTSRLRLNPSFVEWLMGWPHGSTVCGCSGMESSPYRQRLRSALLSLVLGRTAE